MEILFVLIPLSVLLIAFALWSFIWSVKNDQFEDLDRQGWSILFNNKDDDLDSANERTQASTEEHTKNQDAAQNTSGESASGERAPGESAPGDRSEAGQQ